MRLGPVTYIFLDELAKSVPSYDLLVLRVLSHFLNQDWQYLALHLHVATEDVDRVEEDVAELTGLALTQQQFYSIALAQVLLDHEALYLFLRLQQKAPCSVSHFDRVCLRARRHLRSGAGGTRPSR